MNFIKKYWPLGIILLICSLIYYEFVLFGKVPLPADTLVGAYFPWLDFKWGYAVGVPVKNALTSDAFSTFFVWKQIIVEMYSKGVIPLWNKYSLSGTPLMATFHSSIFNPANLLLFIPKYGWSLFIFLSSVASASAMYIFLRDYVKNRIALIAGSLVFAFSGPMTTWAEFGTAVWAAPALPLLLYFIRRYFYHSRPIFLTLISITTALLVFAGHVQLLTYTFAIVPLFLVFLYKTERIKNFKTKVFFVSISLILGVGVGAIQLLPTSDFYSRSIRGEEKYAAGFNYGLSPIKDSVRLLAADLFGHPARANYFSTVNYHEYSSYLGAISIPLILYLLIAFPLNLITIFFALLFWGSLFLAFDNPISRAIFSLPLPLLTYSSASRLFFITGFSASALVAIALEKINEKRTKFISLAMTVLYSILFILFTILPIGEVNRYISIRNSVVYIGVLVSLLISLVFLKKWRRILLWVILMILVVDLGRYFNKYNTFVKSELIFPKTPIIEWLQQQPKPFRIARENTALFPPNTWTSYGIESIEGYDPLYSLDYGRFFHVINGKDYKNAVSRYALLDRVNKKFLDIMNVKYFLTIAPLPHESESGTLFDVKKSGFKEVFRDGRVIIFENPDVYDRAYFTPNIIPVTTQDEAFEKISAPEFDPRPSTVVLNAPSAETKAEGNQVQSIDHRDGQMTITTRSSSKSFLVISDSFDPGWKAWINDVPTKIYKTNASLMGVVVPEGDNTLTLKYLPDGFIKGVYISSISLLAIFILFIIHKIKPPHEK